MSRSKDTDYLYSTARVRALERSLLQREQTERMLDAKTNEDAVKVLAECGYQEFPATSVKLLEDTLTQERLRVYKLLLSFVPHHGIVDVFRIKYDYHNLKAILKAEAMQTDSTHLMMDAGRFEPALLLDAIRKSNLSALPGTMSAAVKEAQDLLARTSDPQLADLVLDHACYAEMVAITKESGSEFLLHYVRISIDAANLKTIVRATRMGKNIDFLRRALIVGGTVETGKLLTAATGIPLEKVFSRTPLEQAAAYGDAASSVESDATLSELERLCDEVLSAHLSKARMVPFGEAPVIAYLASKEEEYSTIRTILTGRMSGVPSDYIRQRLNISAVNA